MTRKEGIIIYLLSRILDIISTYIGLTLGLKETNFVPGLIIKRFGINVFVLYNILISIIIWKLAKWYFIKKRKEPESFKIVSLIYIVGSLIIATLNFVNIYFYLRGLNG